jgi:hypothetical protein
LPRRSSSSRVERTAGPSCCGGFPAKLSKKVVAKAYARLVKIVISVPMTEAAERDLDLARSGSCRPARPRPQRTSPRWSG